METAQLISEEWESLSGQYTAEEADFMTQFLGGTYSCDLATNIDSLFFGLGDAKLSSQYFDDNLSKQINYESIDHEGSGLELVRPVLAADLENTAKRFRSSIEVSKNMRNVRKCPNSAFVSNNEEGLMWHGSKNCFSQVDSSNASIEQNRGTSPSLSPIEPKAPNLYRKSKATSSLATDAQSIYAR
ncbi:transcription factor bHLH84-like, partial [Trifolium medium]|nr:transcription factor bHLH84-like [Trifolium medium]